MVKYKKWRGGKKTHASSPSTSGKTHEKTCPIQTRRETTRNDSRKPNAESFPRLFQANLLTAAVCLLFGCRFLKVGTSFVCRVYPSLT